MDTKGMSLAAMIFGICGIVLAWVPVTFLKFLALPCAIVAIILAAISLKKIKEGAEGNKGMAIAGLVCGIVSCASAVLSVLCLIVCAGAILGAANAAAQDAGLNNLFGIISTLF